MEVMIWNWQLWLEIPALIWPGNKLKTKSLDANFVAIQHCVKLESGITEDKPTLKKQINLIGKWIQKVLSVTYVIKSLKLLKISNTTFKLQSGVVTCMWHGKCLTWIFYLCRDEGCFEHSKEILKRKYANGTQISQIKLRRIRRNRRRNL